jgi:hypothetical protein
VTNLFEQYNKTRSEIDLILKQINSIVAFTPLGCAELLSETYGFYFYNLQVMSNGFRTECEVFVDL